MKPYFPRRITISPAINPTYMGDYDQAGADNANFYTTWGDNRLADAAHAHNPDVRFAKIPVTTGAMTALAQSANGGAGPLVTDGIDPSWFLLPSAAKAGTAELETAQAARMTIPQAILAA